MAVASVTGTDSVLTEGIGAGSEALQIVVQERLVVGVSGDDILNLHCIALLRICPLLELHFLTSATVRISIRESVLVGNVLLRCHVLTGLLHRACRCGFAFDSSSSFEVSFCEGVSSIECHIDFRLRLVFLVNHRLRLI